MITEELTILKKNGLRIAGLAFIPDKGEGNYPTVIFSHGFGSNYRELMHHGDGFADAGIACVFFDFCGGGLLSKSDGTMKEMTVLTEASDLEDVLNEVSKRSYADKERIFLQGESMGGFVSALVAAKHPSLIKALVLWYPAFVIPEDSKRRFEQNDNTCFGHKLSPEYNRVAMNIDIYSEIAKYRGPVKLIHGDRDLVVPLNYSKRAVEAYHEASLEVISGAGHGFDGKDSRRARELSIDFIREHLSYKKRG